MKTSPKTEIAFNVNIVSPKIAVIQLKYTAANSLWKNCKSEVYNFLMKYSHC